MENQKKPIFVAGHQPNYLPYIGFFNKIHQADRFVIVDTVQYEKKGYQNRNTILTNNGLLLLTVPVITSGKFYQNISEVKIDNSTPWWLKHWKSIEFAYKKAPFFTQYSNFFREVYWKKWDYLVDLNETLILGILDFLNIHKNIVRTSTFNSEGKKTELLISICRKTNSDGYLSGGGAARSYVNEELFTQQGLLHRFQQFKHPIYPQIHGGFVPNISILDLLFNCGPESEKIVKEPMNYQNSGN